MKAAKLVDACSTMQEVRDLLWAVLDALGPREAALILRERFYVNGTREECAAVVKALEDVNLPEFDKWAGGPEHYDGSLVEASVPFHLRFLGDPGPLVVGELVVGHEVDPETARRVDLARLHVWQRGVERGHELVLYDREAYEDGMRSDRLAARPPVRAVLYSEDVCARHGVYPICDECPDCGAPPCEQCRAHIAGQDGCL